MTQLGRHTDIQHFTFELGIFLDVNWTPKNGAGNVYMIPLRNAVGVTSFLCHYWSSNFGPLKGLFCNARRRLFSTSNVDLCGTSVDGLFS